MKLAPLTAAIAALIATPALGANLRVEMQIPRMPATEYHFPYVAIWVERRDETPVMNLAVWYDQRLRGQENERYLAELRTWWRKIGRDTHLPLDGVSGATRAPGLNGVALLGSQFPLRDLQRGRYNVVIEAAREEGGRELIRIPFEWNGQSQVLTARGETEIGRITLEVYP